MTQFYSHDDWTLFRQIGTLCQKAGVAPHRLQRTMLKELTDNALDACGECIVGHTEDGGFFVEDFGQGIPPEQIPVLFSIRRPLTTSKLIRLPTRGALGNGLRAVVGSVLSSGGSLTVHTHGRYLRLEPQDDGTTKVIEDGPSDKKQGLRVEIKFGPNMPSDRDPLGWSQLAIEMAGEKPIYLGKTSPHWEDADSFFERCQAAVGRTVREVVHEFDGCTGKKAGDIAAEFKGRQATSVSREEAAGLLERARSQAAIVKPKRLARAKACGVELEGYAHASAGGMFSVTSSNRPPYAASIPYSVEAWVSPAVCDRVTICCNRTPVVGDIEWNRSSEKHAICIFGCAIRDTFKVGRKPVNIILNVQSPYIPITTDGKAPNLEPMVPNIIHAIEKAAKSACRQNRAWGIEKAASQKDITFTHLREAVEKASGGRYRYSQRQLFYAIRPYLIEETGKEPSYETFCRNLTEYENEHGDLPGLYRDPRGIVYHPHLQEEIPLGTLTVEEYRRPQWTFNKILYCEKEGFFPILRSVRWPEIYDCALLTSKGTATRAARDLLDLLGETGEDITFYAIHDADAYGTNIFQSLQAATAARGARKVKIINLGLEPWEGLEMGLAVESVKKSKDRRPVAPYVCQRKDRDWREWLQTNRIELNAMTTPQFVEWLSQKMEEHGHRKVLPPLDVLANHLDDHLHKGVKEAVMERILAEQGFDQQLKAAVAQVQPMRDQLVLNLVDQLARELAQSPSDHWTQPVQRSADDLLNKNKDLL